MKVYIYFFEDYYHLVEGLCRAMIAQNPDCEFIGLAARRRTILAKLANSSLPIKHSHWLGDLEHQWLQTPFDQNKLDYYSQLFGNQKLQHLIYGDRELGFPFLAAGTHARTALRREVESDPQKRWAYVIGMLDYYFNEFNKERPDFIFFNEFTMAYELAAYYVAAYLQIPIRGLYLTRITGLAMVCDNPYFRFTQVEQRYRTVLETDAGLPQKAINQAQDYIDKLRNRPEIPGYSIHFKQLAQRKASITNMLKTLAKDALRCAAIRAGLFGTRGLPRQRYGRDILAANLRCFYYARLAKKGHYFTAAEPLLKSKYIYYPLHYEPEATTLIQCSRVVSQFTIIEQIAKMMPPGYKLLVKEHLPALGLRPSGFYERIMALPGVSLISPYSDNFQLIKQAQLIATLHGTAGLEGLILGKPVLLFDDSDYSIIDDGLLICKSLYNLDQCIATALQLSPADPYKLQCFLACMFAEGLELPLEFITTVHMGLDPDTIAKKYADRFAKIVEKFPLQQHINRKTNTQESYV